MGQLWGKPPLRDGFRRIKRVVALMPAYLSRAQASCAGGAGGGASLTPVGFLVIDKSGVHMIESSSSSVLDKILQIAKDVVGSNK